jgi:hypothetical protein
MTRGELYEARETPWNEKSDDSYGVI